jgi:hypothetical protein
MGAKEHAANVLRAEAVYQASFPPNMQNNSGVRQAPGIPVVVSQAVATQAAITKYLAIRSSALANGIEVAPINAALRSLGVFGFWARANGEAKPMITTTGNATHDANLLVYEQVRQAVEGTSGVTAAQLKTAYIAYYRSCIASAKTNSLQYTQFSTALRELIGQDTWAMSTLDISEYVDSSHGNLSRRSRIRR